LKHQEQIWKITVSKLFTKCRKPSRHKSQIFFHNYKQKLFCKIGSIWWYCKEEKADFVSEISPANLKTLLIVKKFYLIEKLKPNLTEVFLYFCPDRILSWFIKLSVWGPCHTRHFYAYIYMLWFNPGNLRRKGYS